MNITDGVVIIVILIACVAGFYKGLLNTLYKLVTYILAIYLSFKLAKPVSGWFQGTSIYQNIQDGITTFITNLGINFNGLENMTPETISQSIEGVPLPEKISESVSQTLSTIGGGAASMLESFIISITNLILLILCGLILFLIFKLLFALIGHVIKGVSEIPVIKQLDRIGGGILGIGIGIIIVYILALALTFFISKESMQPIFTLVGNSKIAILFYDKNILIGLLDL